MGRSEVAVLIALIVAIGGCGGEPAKDDPEGHQSFEPSFLSDGDYRLQRVSALRFSGDASQVLADIEAHGLVALQAGNIQTETYDGNNRFVKSEIIVYPVSSDSALPEEGARALLVEHVYQSETGNLLDYAEMHLWDNWSDAATGRQTVRTHWIDEAFVHDVPTISHEEIVIFDISADEQTVTDVQSTSSKLIYNDQHLLIERHVDQDSDLSNGYERVDTWRRDADGRLLEVISDGAVILNAYDYDSEGRLSGISYFSPLDGSLTASHSYQYLFIEGQHAIVVDKRVNIGAANEYLETDIRLYEQKPCHVTTVNRLRFSVPEYVNCESATNW